MSKPYERIDVSEWLFVRTETIGQSPAVWIRDPKKDDDSDHHWLFKPVEVHSNGTQQGGDWAEKIAGELATFLGIPCAVIELAVRDGVLGSISRNVIPRYWSMWSGRLWLDADPRLPYRSGGATKSKRKGGASAGYSIESIHTALEGVGPPLGESSTDLMSGFEVFSGYLLLDALIANRDRHEDNWGVVEPTLSGPEGSRLSKTFDQAGSLGYQLTDEGRLKILNAPGGLAKWVTNGTAWRFESEAGARPVSLVELARLAAEYVGNPSDLQWLARLDSLTPSVVSDMLNRATAMSVVSRTFAKEVILTNAERIRDGYRNSAS